MPSNDLIFLSPGGILESSQHEVIGRAETSRVSEKKNIDNASQNMRKLKKM